MISATSTMPPTSICRRRSSESTSVSTVSIDDLPVYDFSKVKTDGHGGIARGGVNWPFPWRLHECLEAVEKEGLSHIVSFLNHGRAFKVFKPKLFAELVMPRFFSQTKYASFQRQLNIYGFNRFLQGQDKGSYYHLCFVRGHRSLVRNMVRRKIKGGVVSTARETMERESKFNFYDPMWQNHFEPRMPSPTVVVREESREERVVSPQSLPSSVDVPTAAPVSPLSSTNTVPYNDPDVSFMTNPLGSEHDQSNKQHDDASIVSDNEIGLFTLLEQTIDSSDDLLAMFEGNAFHMLDQPTPAVLGPPSGVCSCYSGNNHSYNGANLEPLPLF